MAGELHSLRVHRADESRLALLHHVQEGSADTDVNGALGPDAVAPIGVVDCDAGAGGRGLLGVALVPVGGLLVARGVAAARGAAGGPAAAAAAAGSTAGVLVAAGAAAVLSAARLRDRGGGS